MCEDDEVHHKGDSGRNRRLPLDEQQENANTHKGERAGQARAKGEPTEHGTLVRENTDVSVASCVALQLMDESALDGE